MSQVFIFVQVTPNKSPKRVTSITDHEAEELQN